MFKNTILFLFTLTAVHAYGQDERKVNPNADFKRIQTGIIFSPDYCFRSLKNNDGSSSSDQIIASRNNGEMVKLGYSTGLNVCFNFNGFIGLESGIQFSNKGYQTKMKEVIFAQPNPSGPSQMQLIYNLQYIDIPLKANFTFGKNKVRFFPSAGVTTNIFIKETLTTVVVNPDGTNRNTSPTNVGYSKVNISPTVSVGIDYKINDKMNLRVEPTFRYGVLKIINDPVTGYLYSGGLCIGYYYGL